MSSFGELPKHLFNKSLEFKYLQTLETEAPYYCLFLVIAFIFPPEELNQLCLPHSIVSDKSYCVSCIVMFFLITDINSHKY